MASALPAQLRRDEAAKGQHPAILPRPLQMLHELDREAGPDPARIATGPASGHRLRIRHHQFEATGSRGVQIARSLPSRMKSRISCTKGWVENSPATSSTRSDKRALIGEEQAIGAADVVDLLSGEAAAAQADDVEARQMGAVAHRHAIGDEVVLETRACRRRRRGSRPGRTG